MPDGGRLHRFAATGCLIVGLLFALPALGQAGQPDGGKNGQDRPADVEDEPSQTDRSLPQPSIADSIASIAKSLEAYSANPESADERRREEGDLEAQQQMAWWAKLMFIAAAAQCLFTGVGIWYIRATLKETRRAVELTAEGTAAAAEAGEATRRSVELAREEFLARHRPKVTIRFIQPEILLPDDKPTVHVTITNIGETDAIIRQIGGDIARRVGEKWIGPGVNAELHPLPEPLTLKSGQRFTFPVYGAVALSPIELRAIHLGDVTLCLVGEIQYRDLRGIVRHTGFHRVYNRHAHKYERPDDWEIEWEE